MKLFKTIGIVIDSIAAVIVTVAKSAENIAATTEVITCEIRTEAELDSYQNLAEKRAQMAATKQKLWEKFPEQFATEIAEHKEELARAAARVAIAEKSAKDAAKELAETSKA
jgi:hypothetical protein